MDEIKIDAILKCLYYCTGVSDKMENTLESARMQLDEITNELTIAKAMLKIIKHNHPDIHREVWNMRSIDKKQAQGV